MNTKAIEERILLAFDLVSEREKQRRRSFLAKMELRILMLLQAMRPRAKSLG